MHNVVNSIASLCTLEDYSNTMVFCECCEKGYSRHSRENIKMKVKDVFFIFGLFYDWIVIFCGFFLIGDIW